MSASNSSLALSYTQILISNHPSWLHFSLNLVLLPLHLIWMGNIRTIKSLCYLEGVNP